MVPSCVPTDHLCAGPSASVVTLGMILKEQSVSATFYQALCDRLPALQDSQGYRRLLGYLAFTNPNSDGEWFLPSAFVAELAGKRVTGKWSAWKYLHTFQEATGIHLQLSDFFTGHCRTITAIQWPEDLRVMIYAERRTTRVERVLLSSGAKWASTHSSLTRQQFQKEALERMVGREGHPVSALLTLPNQAPTQRYAVARRYLPEAHLLVDSQDLDLVDSERERQHNILKAIEDAPQPIYAPGTTTVRIFALNDSIVRLQRDVREVMTQGWITADLKSAQLAIVSRVWNLPDVAAFLESGQSCWRVLCAWIEVEFTETNKGLLKDSLYALIFGAGRDKMMTLMEEGFGPGAYQRFKKQPLIGSLLRGRAIQLRLIRKAGHGIDAYGTLLDLHYIAVKGKPFSYDSSRKILALIAQSYELKLLEPVIALAIEQTNLQHGFSLVTWLHDGFCFVPNKARDKEHWCKTLQEAVREQALLLGIPTELEI